MSVLGPGDAPRRHLAGPQFDDRQSRIHCELLASRCAAMRAQPGIDFVPAPLRIFFKMYILLQQLNYDIKFLKIFMRAIKIETPGRIPPALK